MKQTLDRRTLLKGVGVAGVMASTTLLPEQSDAQDAIRYMRTPANRLHPNRAALGQLPDLPPLEVIALNRMGFGPRMGDLEAFRALGANDEARLQAYVEQQLNPQAIDDSEFETRLSAANFSTLNKSRAELWADHVVANPDWKLQRWRLINRIMTGGAEGIQLNILAHSPSPSSANQLADLWINHILGRAMSDTDRQEIVTFMADGRGGDVLFDLTVEEHAERLVHMVGLILLSPDFQWR